MFDIKNKVLKKYKGKESTVIIPKGVTSIDDEAFLGCKTLKEIIIPDGVVSIGDSAFFDCRSLEQITMPDSVTSIGESAFAFCKSLNKITLSKKLKMIKDCVFKDCKSLSQVTMPDAVASIGSEAFSGCKSLEQITLPHGLKKIMDGTFQDCKSLSQIIIPDSVILIGDSAFNGCKSLMQVIISNNVTSIADDVFSGCSSLKQITLPDNIKTIASGAFLGCSSLKQIIIPETVTSIGSEAFAFCRSLKQVIIPDSVTSIEMEAFEHCKSLLYNVSNNIKYLGNDNNKHLLAIGAKKEDEELLEIENGCKFISFNAFENCLSLKKVIIPDSVISIDRWAFKECKLLKEITILGKPAIENDAFSNKKYLLNDEVFFTTKILPNCFSKSLQTASAKAYAYVMVYQSNKAWISAVNDNTDTFDTSEVLTELLGIANNETFTKQTFEKYVEKVVKFTTNKNVPVNDILDFANGIVDSKKQAIFMKNSSIATLL